MTKKKGSLFYQFVCILKEQKEIGDGWRSHGGKDAAKDAYRKEREAEGKSWNPSTADGIFSHETHRSYLKSLKEFSGYLKEQGVKNVSDVTKKQAVAFLRDKQESGMSHYTVAKDTAAINKALNHGINKHDTGIGSRSDQEITRGRSVERDETYLKREESNQEQIEFTKAFGTRRQSIQPSRTNYPVKPLSLFKRDGEVYCSLIEKGGKYREVKCLEAYKQVIEERYNVQESFEQRNEESFKDLYFQSGQAMIFSSYDKNINNHAYRAEFACELYKQIESDWKDQGRSVEANYSGFNRAICCEVGKSLGHGANRPEVLVKNYAYGFDRI